MCGLCGILRRGGISEGDRAFVELTNLRQAHRGPESSGISNGEQVALGHTRLAIVGLSEGGRQPFVSEDGTVTVVFNGEIYNHRQLRREFGLRTAEQCDGAVLPELWQLLGVGMFGHLRGMFAIAVHDAAAGTLTLARDPFGIKPLYWTASPAGSVAFASEPRSLLPLLGTREISTAALTEYLRFGAIGRDNSPFLGVESVPANAWSQWNTMDLARRDGVVCSDLFAGPGNGPTGLREAFLDSVGMHLISDVPVALLLSAGVDSAALALACAELGKRLTCVTVDMGGDVRESGEASLIARRFGHEHVTVSNAPSPELIERFFASMQRPSIDGLNTFMVSGAISSLGLKVALSGLGGDEMLAGYPVFRFLRYLQLLRIADRLLPGEGLGRLYRGRNEKLRLMLGNGGPRDAVSLGRLSRRVLLDQQVARLAPGLRPAADRQPRSDRLARTLSLTELTGYLGGTLLADTDAFSMAWSVEMRVPFIDPVFASTALAFDPKRGVGKRRFADILRDDQLRRISSRPKRNFTMPMDQWMRTGALSGCVRDALDPQAPVRALLDPGAVDSLIQRWQHGQIGWSKAWTVVSLNAWLGSLDGPGGHGVGFGGAGQSALHARAQAVAAPR